MRIVRAMVNWSFILGLSLIAAAAAAPLATADSAAPGGDCAAVDPDGNPPAYVDPEECVSTENECDSGTTSACEP